VVDCRLAAAFASGQLTSLFSYESSYGVRQIDGYTAPYLGETSGTAVPLTAPPAR